MSARREARNERIKAKQVADKKKEEDGKGTCLKPQLSTEDLAKELVRLKTAWTDARDKVEKFITYSPLHYVPKDVFMGRNNPAHFAGENSVAETEKLHRLEQARNIAWNKYKRFRLTHDAVYRANIEENNAKIAFWKSMETGGKISKPVVKSSGKIHEVIHRFHSNAFDPKSPILCKHYDRDSLTPLQCDCERIFMCGCQQKPVCSKCGTSTCFCGIQLIKYDRENRTVTCNNTDSCDFYPDNDHNIKQWKISVRGSARIAQNKAQFIEKVTVRITRNSAGFLIGTCADGKFDESSVRCYHIIDSCDEYVPCDCVRDQSGRFELSEAAKTFIKNGGIVQVDQRCVENARRLVKELPPNTCTRNPHGFGGYDLPTHETIPPDQKRQNEVLHATAMKYFQSNFE